MSVPKWFDIDNLFVPFAIEEWTCNPGNRVYASVTVFGLRIAYWRT